MTHHTYHSPSPPRSIPAADGLGSLSPSASQGVGPAEVLSSAEDLQLVEAVGFLVFLPRPWPLLGVFRLRVWGMQGQTHRLRTSPSALILASEGSFLLPIPRMAAREESAFRLALARVRALAAELPQPGALTAGLNYPGSQPPRALVPAALTHTSMALRGSCVSVLGVRACVCVRRHAAGAIP